MLDAQEFERLYELTSGNQTIDDSGDTVDCGIRCDKHCCRPGHTTKYLLPGEREYLQTASTMQASTLGAHVRPFEFASLGYFDTIVEDPDASCVCAPLRGLRPFNCRIFPYGADIVDNRVVGLRKGRQSYLAPCWIETPAPLWEAHAIEAWQMVLDDVDNRAFFARLCTLWEWNQAIERGEEPGPVLFALSALQAADDDEIWSRVARFFRR